MRKEFPTTRRVHTSSYGTQYVLSPQEEAEELLSQLRRKKMYKRLITAAIAVLCVLSIAASMLEVFGDVTAPVTVAPSTVSASWTITSVGADGTRLYQLSSSGHAAKVCDVTGSVSSCLATVDLTAGACFVAVSYQGLDESPDSNKACFFKLTAPASLNITIN